MSKYVFFIEIFLVYGIILGWAFWELNKTSRLAKKTREEEEKKKLEEAQGSSLDQTS
ncbi:MAG: hypothetical protein ACX939_01755 [Hyphococcus sp.]